MPGLATDMGMRAPRRLFPQRHQRVTRSPGERGRRGSKTGSHRRQTWGDTRRHRATMGAASWLKARHLATSRNGRIAPEKRKVGGSTPPLTTTTSDQRKRCCLLFRLPCVANGFANASLHGLAFTAWAKMSPTPAACSRRTWGYTRKVTAGSAWPRRATIYAICTRLRCSWRASPSMWSPSRARGGGLAGGVIGWLCWLISFGQLTSQADSPPVRPFVRSQRHRTPGSRARSRMSTSQADCC